MTGIPQDRVDANLQSETTRFVQLHPRSRELHERARKSVVGNAVAHAHGLPWYVTQIGARVEYRFQPQTPRNGTEALAGVDSRLDRLIHLFFMNRGVLVASFHNMLLVSPETTAEDVDRQTAIFNECVAALSGADS
jgi:glutamate-1-semialdehyde aminotransferase